MTTESNVLSFTKPRNLTRDDIIDQLERCEMAAEVTLPVEHMQALLTQLLTLMDKSVAQSADREMLKRLAVILSGSDAPGEIKALTVTAQSFVDRCKTLAKEREAKPVPSEVVPVIPDCWCRTCRPVKMNDMRFVVCPECGNKRCPHANDHRNACTGSNEPGQESSTYPAAPQQG